MSERILWGILMAAAIIGVLVAIPPWGLGLVVLFAWFVCSGEFIGMARPEASLLDATVFRLAILIPVLWPLLQARFWPDFTHGQALTLAVFVLAVFHVLRPEPLDGAARRLALDTLGAMYIGLTFPLIYLLRDRAYGGYFTVLVMAITFLQDTGGYFAGKYLGKHKLYPKLSPKKTVEGALGGVALATAGTFVARAILPGQDIFSAIDCVVLGCVGASMGICGDLFESMLKRSFGVKDAGTLIPGHGGFLDRVDGLLFVGPFAYFYVELFVR